MARDHAARLLALALVGVVGLALSACSTGPAAAAEEAAGASGLASLERPEWRIGDSWMIETLTRRIQGRETEASGEPPRLRWKFHVTNYEKVAGADCYRIDIKCLASGRMRPKATIWCDKQTLFLRQFQTQLAFNGRYRTIQESFACPKGQYSPVLASVNVLPLGLPAFLPKGAKAGDAFSYVSQPLPAGSKDPSIVRFVHTVKQQIGPADAKSLKQVPREYSKDLQAKPVTEVTLADHRESVVQLWQKGVPWPVYVDNGRTQAWLVSTERP